MRNAETVQDLAKLTRQLQACATEQEQLQVAADAAVTIVKGCDHAIISIVEGRRIEMTASSDDVAQRVDALQHALEEGPSVDAVRWGATVGSPDLGRESRWPHWSGRVRRELGVQSAMSVLVYTDAGSLGALSLFGDRVEAFTSGSRAVAHALAAQVAVALATSREIGRRGVAMARHTTMGQAQGILMERLGITADQALASLAQAAERTSRPIEEVCEEIVRAPRLVSAGPRPLSRAKSRSD